MLVTSKSKILSSNPMAKLLSNGVQLVALVTVFILLIAPPSLADTTATCGVAAGEKITAHDIEIRCGLTFEQVRELFKSDSASVTALVEVSKKLGVKELAIKGFLETIKREQVPDEKLAETFATIAKDYLSLLNDRQSITTGGAEAQELLKQADSAIDAGKIAEAKNLLVQVAALRDEQRKKREELREELDKADLDDAAVDVRTANIRVPIGRAQSDKSWNQIDTLIFVCRLGKRASIGGILQYFQSITQPLHRCTRNKDRSFQRIGALAIKLIGDRGE